VSRWGKADLYLTNPVEDSPDFEREINLVVNFLPGYPAQTHGQPEDCYPAESTQFEILSAKYDDGRDVPSEIIDALPEEKILELLDEQENADDNS